MRLLRVSPLLLVLAVPALAHAATTTVVVAPNANTFTPANFTITAGDKVTWTHDAGNRPHNVDVSDGFVNGPTSSAAWKASHTFNTPGTFTYKCDLHGPAGMTGTITVMYEVRLTDQREMSQERIT